MYNHQLDTFLEVARSGSFSKAAEALFISPTAVIKQMNLLEGRVGVRLFVRTHQGLTLTEAGESLEKDARRIIRVCDESVQHAREAERSEKRIVRVATSIMTPATYLTNLWPSISKRCSDISIKLVPFENNPENAKRILGNLGDEADIVFGVFDDNYLRWRRCFALELSLEPIRLAVPIAHPLANKKQLAYEDLEGQTIMLIRRGWNLVIDELRDEIETEHPGITIKDYDFYNVDVFNRCESEGWLLWTIDGWSGAHPMVRTLPMDWDFRIPFGALHAEQPEEHVQRLLNVLADQAE